MNLMVTVLTAWGYELSLLELIAFITAVIGVGLGVLGPRKTWPWWIVSSLLYAALFFQWNYYASGFLQFIFVAGAIAGWFGWGPKGAIPKRLSRREIQIWGLAYLLAWFSLYPLLKSIGAAASLTDAFGFVGSCIAQFLMVLQRYESWIIWFVVDAVYVYQYWNGGQYLTAILYFIFVLIAVAGWKRWLREAKSNSI
ncbi:MAG: nicotinamide riboside transporter PnuC [Actinomycetota bacterium]|jgi:nicotinamide mononucleotide transporter|tara:strand:- start:17397 stop:17987 length:591 start_codon:yes stop_codon:yes gene_type:complete